METININKEVKKPRQKVLDPKKLEEQEVFMDKVRELNDQWAKKKHRRPVVGCGTFGCQMNEHDSEELAYMLERMGYERTEKLYKADLIISNTCAVREKAEMKVYGN